MLSQGEKKDKLLVDEAKPVPLTAAKVQGTLSSFFGQNPQAKENDSPTVGSKVTKRGSEPPHDDFPEGKVDIWNWNVNGVYAIV